MFAVQGQVGSEPGDSGASGVGFKHAIIILVHDVVVVLVHALALSGHRRQVGGDARLEDREVRLVHVLIPVRVRKRRWAKAALGARSVAPKPRAICAFRLQHNAATARAPAGLHAAGSQHGPQPHDLCRESLLLPVVNAPANEDLAVVGDRVRLSQYPAGQVNAVVLEEGLGVGLDIFSWGNNAT